MLGAADNLLRSCAWDADKLLKQHRGQFSSVLFVAEYADGSRQRLQRSCNNAPNSASDADLLTDLAQDVALDFAEAKVAVTRFCVAYLCKRTIVLRPDDPNATMKPTTTRRQGVIIELHSSDNEPVGIFREILRSSGGKSMLGAAETLEGSFADSPYAGILKLVAECKAADAKVQAEAKAKAVAAKAKVKAQAKVAARQAAQWPPRFLLNSPRRPIQPASSGRGPGPPT